MFNNPLSIKDLFSTLLCEKKFRDRITAMCIANGSYIEMEYESIENFNEILIELLLNKPESFFAVGNEILNKEIAKLFPNYHLIEPACKLSIVDLPVTSNIDELRTNYLNKLVQFDCVVTGRSSPFAILHIYSLICKECNSKTGPFTNNEIYREETVLFKNLKCYNCQRTNFKVSSDSKYRDIQQIEIQDSFERQKRTIPYILDILVEKPFINKIKPGDHLTICGLVNISYERDNIFKFTFLLNSLKQKTEELKLKRKEEEEIIALSKNKNLKHILLNSIGSNLCGNKEAKEALLLALLGGTEKQNIRSNINILLIGDPGLGKSQLLKEGQKYLTRSVYACGTGSSAVGLTASLRKERSGFFLEGGALVLADRGVAFIDEFEKCKESDRVALHEAMEQQTISISKGGIVCTLNARTAIVAAANPKGGNYNPMVPLKDNTYISFPIISRFDLIVLMRDRIDESVDRQIAKFIIEKNIGEESKEEKISENLLKKYIYFARNKVDPVLTDEGRSDIKKLYASLRSLVPCDVPITPRFLESTVRISEAYARMSLSKIVIKSHINSAINTVLRNFIPLNRHSIANRLYKKYIHIIGDSTFMEESAHYLLNGMWMEQFKISNDTVSINIDFFRKRLDRMNISICLDNFFQSEKFRESGYVFDGENIIK